MFYFNTEPRLKWYQINLATKIILISFQMLRLKWNKIVLAAKTILFHFRHGCVLKKNYLEFQTQAAAIGHHAKTILFHYRRGSVLK